MLYYFAKTLMENARGQEIVLIVNLICKLLCWKLDVIGVSLIASVSFYF
jgi:hypothetical protein